LAPKFPPKKGCHNLKDIINLYGNSYPEEVFYSQAEELIVSQLEAPSDGTDFESIKFNMRNKPAYQVGPCQRKRETSQEPSINTIGYCGWCYHVLSLQRR
jgi:hypothetical protein